MCIRDSLKRVLGTLILSYDSLETLLLKIEACVNSRPITKISSEANDLTPFPIGELASLLTRSYP